MCATRAFVQVDQRVLLLGQTCQRSGPRRLPTAHGEPNLRPFTAGKTLLLIPSSAADKPAQHEADWRAESGCWATGSEILLIALLMLARASKAELAKWIGIVLLEEPSYMQVSRSMLLHAMHSRPPKCSLRRTCCVAAYAQFIAEAWSMPKD
eukprot:6173544-Pleurochrysis_carterae.AAC.1